MPTPKTHRTLRVLDALCSEGWFGRACDTVYLLETPPAGYVRVLVAHLPCTSQPATAPWAPGFWTWLRQSEVDQLRARKGRVLRSCHHCGRELRLVLEGRAVAGHVDSDHSIASLTSIEDARILGVMMSAAGAAFVLREVWVEDALDTRAVSGLLPA